MKYAQLSCHPLQVFSPIYYAVYYYAVYIVIYQHTMKKDCYKFPLVEALAK